MTDKGSRSPERLNGWKEIGAYFGRTPRTVQRWEKDLGLKVHRIKTAGGGETLYALRSELDAWLASVEGQTGVAEPPDVDDPPAGPPRPLVEPAPPAPAGPRPLSWKHPRVRLFLVFAAVLAAIIASVLLWSFGRSAAGDRVADRQATPASAGAALDEGGQWPSAAHDGRQSNQGHSDGPANPGPARLVLEAPRLLGFFGSMETDDDFLVVTARGDIIAGWPGEVVSVTPSGEQVWTAAIRHPFGEVGPSGFALRATVVCFGTHYTTTRMVHRTYVRCLGAADGRETWTREQFSPTQAPTFGRDDVFYQLDEVGALRAYTLNGENRWTTVLAGYAMGAVALDRTGNLYAGTDGGNYNSTSVWSVAPDGKIRWTREAAGTFLTPVVSRDDRVFVASQEGTLLALDAEGRELWRLVDLPRALSRFPLALDAGGPLYYRHVGGVLCLDRNGKVQWSFTTGDEAVAASSPILDRRGHVYLSGKDEVLSLTPKGEVRWRVPLKHPGRLVIGGEGTLYVVSEHRKIYAIEDASLPNPESRVPFLIPAPRLPPSPSVTMAEPGGRPHVGNPRLHPVRSGRHHDHRQHSAHHARGDGGGRHPLADHPAVRRTRAAAPRRG